MDARCVAGVIVAGLGCGNRERSPPTEPTTAPIACRRERAEKLGVPFVRICPDDLPGVIREPFWITSAPVGCTGGEHGTVPCPMVIPLSRPAEHEPSTSPPIPPRLAQMTDDRSAHRTCTLRFGGRLPTSAELAQAAAALGLVAVVVTEPATTARLEFRALAEWATEAPCTVPSTLGACRTSMFPADATTHVAWSELRACTAIPIPAADALVVGVGDGCWVGDSALAALAPCLLGAPTPAGPSTRSAFGLKCRGLTADQSAHPAEHTQDRAAFRCVVPDHALEGVHTPG
jgi:hypothetical protein